MLHRAFVILQFLFYCGGKVLAQDTCVATQNVPLKWSAAQMIAPVSLAGTGLLFYNSTAQQGIADYRNEHYPNFKTKVDDVLSLAPIAVVYALDWAGVAARNDFANRTAILVKGELMMLGSVYLLKAITDQPRPDGSDLHSFPSSHSAQAFLAATFLSEEYGHNIRWMPYAAYTVASGVAVLRMANNKHYIGDVLVGAGIGILAQKLSYWAHQYKWGKKRNVVQHFVD